MFGLLLNPAFKWVAGVAALAALVFWLRHDAVDDYKADLKVGDLENQIEDLEDAQNTRKQTDEIPDGDLADFGSRWLLEANTPR